MEGAVGEAFRQMQPDLAIAQIRDRAQCPERRVALRICDRLLGHEALERPAGEDTAGDGHAASEECPSFDAHQSPPPGLPF
jgi:hypothetical protein